MRGASQRGFTLTELLVGCTMAGIVMTAVISAYLFLGRDLTRLSYNQALESKSRIALAYLTNDFKQASEIQSESGPSSPSDTRLKLKLVTGVSVIYAYDSTNSKLTRTAGANPAVVLLADTGSAARLVYCTAFDFNYYTTTSGNPTFQSTTTLVPFSIKQVEVSFTLRAGSGSNGTQVQQRTVSARFSTHNRALPTGS